MGVKVGRKSAASAASVFRKRKLDKIKMNPNLDIMYAYRFASGSVLLLHFGEWYNRCRQLYKKETGVEIMYWQQAGRDKAFRAYCWCVAIADYQRRVNV